MQIEPTNIRDVYVLTPVVHEDVRGFFMETYRNDALKSVGVEDAFVQDNHSRSVQRNTIRGLHFQWDAPMAKIMRVTRGSAFLVAVDIRKNSPTLGKWFGIEASEDNKKQLYAPAGFARGFQTLTENCEVQYKCSALYNPETQGEIAWDDSSIAIDWPIKEQPAMLDKDRSFPSLSDWLARPESEFFTF